MKQIDIFAVHTALWNTPEGRFTNPILLSSYLEDIIWSDIRLFEFRNIIHDAYYPIHNHIRHTLKSNQHE